MEGGTDHGRLTEVAIVGAGIAGTTLAVACRQGGLAVRLYDRGSPKGPVAPLLELTANGTRVLQALGLREALAGISLSPSFAAVRDSRTGFLLTQRPLGPFSEARYGAPCCLVRADELRRLLRATAANLDIPLETPVLVTDVDTASATLTLQDGRTIPHLAVALATGRPSAGGAGDLSSLLESRRWHLPRGPTLIRARSCRAEPDRDHDRFVNTWLGPGFAVVERPDRISADGLQPVELTAVSAAPRTNDAAADVLKRLLATCHPHLASLAEGLDAAYVDAPIADVAGYWQAGRAVMLGAVCHGAPVYPELEPSAALEDAWILSRMMERWEDEPHEEFAEYERFRRARARRLRAFAEAELADHTLQDRAACWRRNLKWSLTGRFLPEITMQKLDWLYGYDCIRGFA